VREAQGQEKAKESEEGDTSQRRPEGKSMTVKHRVKQAVSRSLTATPLLAAAASVAAMLLSASASAAGCPEGSLYTGCAPGWEITTQSLPTNLVPGGQGMVEVAVYNVGAGFADSPVTVTDELPEGLEATNVGELEPPDKIAEGGQWACTGAKLVTCTAEPARGFPNVGGGAGAGYPMRIGIEVKVAEHPVSDSVVNRASVAGGGAPTSASTSQAFTLSSTPAVFGFDQWNVWFANADGTTDTQAGSHPYSATFSFNLNTEPRSDIEPGAGKRAIVSSGGHIDEIVASLPSGLVGDPHAVPQCTRAELNSQTTNNTNPPSGKRIGCPLASQIGILESPTDFITAYFPVFNMVPPPGAPAEFGFKFIGYATFIVSSVRTGSDYGIESTTKNIPQVGVLGSTLILWGYPADASHNYWRSEAGAGSHGCDGPESGSGEGQECPEKAVAGGLPKPFLTLPTSCAGPQTFSIRGSMWETPSLEARTSVLTHDSEDEPAGLTGCEHLGFEPVVSLAPETSYADTPAGLTVEVKPPVGGLSELEGNSTADVQNTKVVLPEGLAINPGQAAGLAACGPTEDGLTTQAEKEKSEEDTGPPSCPSASKVGTVSISTPLLSETLQGNVYVLQSNPPELKLLVAASAEGVNVKLVGTVHLNESTGQLTSTFEGTPELPFTDFKLSFSGGAQAALATPTHCGVYTSDADFTPWSSPFIGDYFGESSFAIAGGTGGAACPGSPLPFGPKLIAGSTTDQAGGYTDFSLLLQAPDDQQRISSLQFKTPEGLLGMISRVPLCTNAQAETNTCPEASQIGHTVVSSGPGPYPLTVPEAGQPPAPIYLTEGYKGAPYGLSIVVPLKVGPFTLPTQRVRARIEVDPLTTQLTVITDPLPQYVGGVPTDLRTIDAVVDKPEFMFNPTGCSPRAFSGTAYGIEGATAPISSSFQMGSCRALLFQPNFKVSTSGKISRADGASLAVKIVYPTGNLGANQASSQSNIEKVKVELPKRLPSRLTTLQKACTAAQFDANPAGCPADSVVGHATAVTPVLPVPLNGPAYFVSNGGEAFPNLIIVLQGYGVTVHLIGDTFISKAGITSSTFKQVPDVPIGSFELTLPEGPFSALTGLGNLCVGEKLVMPTEFVGQNGAEIHQSTKIEVTGCAKHKAEKAAHRKAHKKKPKAHRGTAKKRRR
jgi:hypothetical protein